MSTGFHPLREGKRIFWDQIARLYNRHYGGGYAPAESESVEEPLIPQIGEEPTPIKAHYLIGEAGYPNYGDELITREWIKYLAQVDPEVPVVLDCLCSGPAAAIVYGLHPNVSVVDTASTDTIITTDNAQSEATPSPSESVTATPSAESTTDSQTDTQSTSEPSEAATAQSDEEVVEQSSDSADDQTVTGTGSTTTQAAEDVPPNPQHMWAEGAQQEQEAQDTASQNQSARPRLRAYAAGPRWGTTGANGTYKTFTDGAGKTFNPAKKVIDVSEWQGNIDWNKVKNSGVDGVILRLGYGIGNEDKTFAQNLAKVRALKIPFGLYLYSYAYDANFARDEANWTAQLMRTYGINDNQLPIFYDLEQGNWGGHVMPSNATQYEQIARTYFDTLANQGYRNAYIYSYLNLMNTKLNSQWLRSKTAWIAQYNTQLDYGFADYNGARAWQYTSASTVPGISGNVDMNVFDNQLFRDVTFRTPHNTDIVWMKQYNIADGYPDGTYGGMRTVVRKDMAAFLRRLARNRNISDARTWTPSAADWNKFTDVNRSTIHAEDILWLAHAGIATGYSNGDGTWRFENETPVYRQDMAAFIKRLADKAGKSGGVRAGTFTDVNDGTPHAAEVRWLGGSGIAEGYPNGNGTYRFEGMTTVYRQDMAAFIKRLNDRL